MLSIHYHPVTSARDTFNRIADLEKAFTAAIDRHESLRTAFIVDPVTHQPLQAVAPTGRLVLQKKRLESESDMSREFDAVNNIPMTSSMRK